MDLIRGRVNFIDLNEGYGTIQNTSGLDVTFFLSDGWAFASGETEPQFSDFRPIRKPQSGDCLIGEFDPVQADQFRRWGYADDFDHQRWEMVHGRRIA